MRNLIYIAIVLIILKINQMNKILEDLRLKVEQNTAADASAKTLILGIKAELDKAIAGEDWGIVKELSDQIGKDNESLAAAVVAGTNSTPPVIPEISPL